MWYILTFFSMYNETKTAITNSRMYTLKVNKESNPREPAAAITTHFVLYGCAMKVNPRNKKEYPKINKGVTEAFLTTESTMGTPPMINCAASINTPSNRNDNATLA